MSSTVSGALVAVVLAIAATVTAVAGAAPAREVEIVRGRVFDAEAYHADGSTIFSEMLVENAAPGSTVEMSRSTPCAVASVSRTVSGTRIVDLASAAKQMPLQPGCSLSVRLRNPDSRTKTLTFTARAGAAPTRARSCTNASGQAVQCAQACPPAGSAPADVCQGADQTVVAVPLSVGYVRTAGGVRVTRIAVRFEAGSILSLHCSGTSRCPFFTKAGYAATGGEINLAPYLHGRVLAVGTALELWVEHENNIGRVLRAVVRRHTISTQALCISQVDLRPRACS
jgi:hypothetical protein